MLLKINLKSISVLRYYRMNLSRLLFFCLLMVVAACVGKQDRKTSTIANESLFTLLPHDSTAITFFNTLTEGPNTNVLVYEYFYNGAGVAVADLNGDNLEDIYFTGNMTDNKLYLNRGRMKFEDITALAGVQNRQAPWRTGVTIADVNGDGRRDIFVSYSGNVRGSSRISQLFINQGSDANNIPHFSEQAAQYGLADSSYSTQAYFFDYDRDGDLDAFLLNHNPSNFPVLDEASTAALLKQTNPSIGVKLLENKDNFFSDVTAKAGFSNSVLTYGLGAGISDINSDGWPDIYIANDYNVPDYFYINNKNGTFSDKLQTAFGHTSRSSMGNNVSDINNDGLPDIFVLDMLPEDNKRQKLLFPPDNYEKFDLNVRSGFYYQYMRNTLQLNNGDGTFSEIGQLAGLSNTDWSWAPLFADYDNDGWKDLYVTNGITHDFTNMDFVKYMADYIQVRGRITQDEVLDIVRKMPASDVVNYLFKNNGDLTFSDQSKAWGMSVPSNSNGAAYADLDNDGDLDLVVNNVNKPAFIYRNEAATQLQHGYLKIKLEGAGKNTDGIGAKLYLYTNGTQQFLEQMPARGFQSSVSPVLHFGLGREMKIDSIKVIWQSGKQQVIQNIKANQIITLFEGDATFSNAHAVEKAPKPAFTETKPLIDFAHNTTVVNDFKRQPLLINPLSHSGPCFVKGDVNGDGLDDVFAGGGSGQAASIFIQQKGGNFQKKPQPAFEGDKECEDADAVFFDANGDGFPDLYAVSGGYHNYAPDDARLQDRLYMNDGRGTFSKTHAALPGMRVSKSCVRAADVNGDGHVDLFAGGRVVPGRYPETPQSFLLINDGKGHFTDQIATIAPQLQKRGMITDAAWIDLNGDGRQDLIVVGEWMPVSVYINVAGKLENKTSRYFDRDYSGWWNKLLVDDFNGDGKPDLVIGNLGLNTQCKASEKEPAELFYKDFDDNGSVDPIFCFYMQGKTYPYITRDELLDQMSTMRPRFTDYKSYADATMNTIFSEEELKGAQRLQANFFKTAYFQMGAGGRFEEKALPLQAQFSPVFTITPMDYDKDGKKDLLLCGNINEARLRFGKYDASYGVLLKGDGRGGFEYVRQKESGFRLTGDVRSVLNLNNTLLFGINGQQAKAYKLN